MTRCVVENNIMIDVVHAIAETIETNGQNRKGIRRGKNDVRTVCPYNLWRPYTDCALGTLKKAKLDKS